jgi:hypothetical protein
MPNFESNMTSILARLSLLLSIPCLLSGCLNFGENTLYTGNEITKKKSLAIQRNAELVFPNAITHLNFYFHGDTIDPCWYYKGEFSSSDMKNFKSSKEFQQYSKRSTDVTGPQFEQLNGWWDVHSAANIEAYEKQTKNSLTFLSLQQHHNKTTIYISNHTY